MTLMFDHIGIVVRDIDLAMPGFCASFNVAEATSRFDDERLTVSVRFFRDSSGMTYELIAPLGEHSVVAGVLKRGTNIVNQIAYRTPSLSRQGGQLAGLGFLALSEPQPAVAFSGARVQFFMSPLGFVVELIEINGWAHKFFRLDQ